MVLVLLKSSISSRGRILLSVVQCSRLLTSQFSGNERFPSYQEPTTAGEGKFGWICGAFIGLLLGGNAACHGHAEDHGNKLLSGEWRRRFFLKYERRLRENSSPQKVFNYFANHSDRDGEKIMDHVDVMRSLYGVVPPPGSPLIRSGSLEGEEIVISSHDECTDKKLSSKILESSVPTLSKVSSADGADGVCFTEWVFINVLISYPTKHLWILFKMIDVDNNGQISKDELAMLLRTLLTRSAMHHDPVSFEKTVSNMQCIMCDIAGKSADIDMQGLMDFCKALSRDIRYIQYAYYGDGMEMTGYDGAMSLIAEFVNLDRVDKCLDIIQNLPSYLREIHIDFEQFQAMHEFIHNIDSVILACNLYNRMTNTSSIDKKAFQTVLTNIKGEAWYQACSSVVDIIFFVVSDNGSEINVKDFAAIFSDQLLTGPVFEENSFSKIRCALQCFKRGRK